MNFNKLRLVFLALALAGCNNGSKLDPLPSPPSIHSFTASVGRVAKGTKVTLAWDTADALTVEIVKVGAGPVSGVDDKAAGSIEVTIDADTLFVLSAFNKRGVKATALVTVGLEGGAGKASFAALPEVISAGGAATLVWNAPGARVITITPAGGTAIDLKGQGELGSVEVKPTGTTLYTLNADGFLKQATVAVEQAVVSFTVSKSLSLPGEAVTLAWKTTGAGKVILTTPGRPALLTETDPAKMADGSSVTTLPNSPLGTVVPYTLSVEGAGPTVTQTVSVVLSNLPEIKTFTAPEYATTGQKFVLTWTTLNADLVELSTGGVVFWTSTSGAQATSGTLSLDTPAASTDYLITARSALGGAGVTKLATVKPVGPIALTSFTASPAVIATGGTAVSLTWNVPNARRLRIIGSDGHTVATARGPGAETGTATAYPNAGITYTLDADNAVDAPLTATQAVTVTTPAQFGAAAGPVFAGNPVALTWSIGTGAPLVGYPHSVVITTAGSTGFVDISATGTKLGFTGTEDDATLTFLPKDFESFVFGNRVTDSVTVSTNGFFVFAASAAARPVPLAIPNTTIERNFIAPYWANLELGGSGRIYWQVLNEAPERTLVVQFDKVKVKGDLTSELTFEAKVHQTGIVTFEYKKIQAAALPASVSGVQGQVDALLVAGAADNVGLTLFGPKAAPIPATFTRPGSAGGFIKLGTGYLKAVYTPTPFVAQGAISITEAMFQPNAAIATTGEWFEVANATSMPLDLNGWTLDFGGTTHTLTTSVILPANGLLVLGQSAAGPLNDDVATGYQYGTGFSMAEPVGSVQLKLLNYSASSSWNQANANNGAAGVSVGVDPNLYLLATDTATTLPHPISCSSTGTFGTQVPAQKGSPGAKGGCFGYAMQPIPVSYFDIAATGTPLFTSTDGDDAVAAVSLASAPFPFFGAPQSTLSVCTNGWALFKSTTNTAFSNRAKPDTAAANAGALAVFWDDLKTVGTGTANVFSKRIAAGEDVSNPLPHWIIQWGHITHLSTNDDLNFQLKIFDNGTIEYHYAAMVSGSTSNYADGNSASVWLENVLGNTALISSVNKPLVLPNSALRFTPN